VVIPRNPADASAQTKTRRVSVRRAAKVIRVPFRIFGEIKQNYIPPRRASLFNFAHPWGQFLDL